MPFRETNLINFEREHQNNSEINRAPKEPEVRPLK